MITTYEVASQNNNTKHFLSPQVNALNELLLVEQHKFYKLKAKVKVLQQEDLNYRQENPNDGTNELYMKLLRLWEKRVALYEKELQNQK